MRKLLLFTALIVSGLLFSACSYGTLGVDQKSDANKPQEIEDKTAATRSAETLEQTNQDVDFTAEFEIYTKGTKRTFSQAMYHNQSEDAYIEPPGFTTVHIKKSDITWRQFFDSLPFFLSEDCLITGTNQMFCNGEEGQLKFILNGQENPQALDSAIQDQDKLRIEYN